MGLIHVAATGITTGTIPQGKGREGKRKGRTGLRFIHDLRLLGARVMDGFVDDAGGWHCDHEWLDRPESDTRECLICGVER